MKLEILLKMPRQGVYALIDSANKKVYIAVVTNAIAWISRNAIDIAYGCHKYNLSSNSSVKCEFKDENILLVRNAYKSICEDYIKNGYTVYGNKRNTKLIVRYEVLKGNIEIRIINTRNKVLYAKRFDKMKDAKKWAKGKTIEQLIMEMDKSSKCLV